MLDDRMTGSQTPRHEPTPMTTTESATRSSPSQIRHVACQKGVTPIYSSIIQFIDRESSHMSTCSVGVPVGLCTIRAILVVDEALTFACCGLGVTAIRRLAEEEKTAISARLHRHAIDCLESPWQVSGVHRSRPVTGSNRNRTDTYGVFYYGTSAIYLPVLVRTPARVERRTRWGLPERWGRHPISQSPCPSMARRDGRRSRVVCTLQFWSSVHNCLLAAPFTNVRIYARIAILGALDNMIRARHLHQHNAKGTNIGIAKRPLLAVKSPSCPLFLVVARRVFQDCPDSGTATT
ncbi:hypothetical protein LZ31DRAFT_367184 [Colletotrichum somersetense]|nr:hypothetical protein LZ31DRAFT_367184 [Colletotrichum somersetense]